MYTSHLISHLSSTESSNDNETKNRYSDSFFPIVDMTYRTVRKILFFSWESPWPAHGGGALRTLGLLKELSKVFEVELMVLSRRPLFNEQMSMLRSYTSRISQVPMKIVSLKDKLRIVTQMLRSQMPYHCAIIEVSFRSSLSALERIRSYPGIVYASYGHWGTLAPMQAPNWILDQHNADVEFWRVYASQTMSYLAKAVALINWRLADKHFRKIYPRVGRIVSVCEEDKQLTLKLCSQAQVDVIENGVDCSYYVPDRKTHTGPPRILFTGTSASRNMIALHQFVRNVFPLIQKELPETELLVGGNFHAKAQAKFKDNSNIRFTGRVDDMRPLFNQSDVYIAPFEETHGSKLKIAEAMAMGMCIVSTPEGVRGFPLVDGESVFIGHSSKEFTEHVVRLLSNPAQRERAGVLVREIALSTIDWKVLGKRLVNIINTMGKALHVKL